MADLCRLVFIGASSSFVFFILFVADLCLRLVFGLTDLRVLFFLLLLLLGLSCLSLLLLAFRLGVGTIPPPCAAALRVPVSNSGLLER